MTPTQQDMAALESLVASGTRLLGRLTDGLIAIIIGSALALILHHLPRALVALGVIGG